MKNAFGAASALVLLFSLTGWAVPETAAAEVSPTAAQSDASPAPFQVEHSAVYTVKAATLGRSYEIFVKTPPGYDDPANASRVYPALYLTDAPYTFQVASGETRVPFNHGDFEAFILIGLSYAVDDDPVLSRERDLTPVVDPRGKPYPTGGARAYLDFIAGEVMPMVEKAYRIDPTRRTLGGQSYGGLFGLWVLFQRPELFQNYILTSSSLWYGKRTLFDAERRFAANHVDLKANVFFAIGSGEHPAPCGRAPSRCSDEDMVADQAAMVKQLNARHYASLKLHTRVIEGAYHTTTFPSGLLWALQELFLTDKLERQWPKP